MNWMLDLIDYEALDMARSTVELRQEDKKRVEGAGTSFVVCPRRELTLVQERAGCRSRGAGLAS